MRLVKREPDSNEQKEKNIFEHGLLPLFVKELLMLKKDLQEYLVVVFFLLLLVLQLLRRVLTLHLE
jgi:hypothetical protein